MTAPCDDGVAAVRARDYDRGEKLLAACTASAGATLDAFVMLAGLHQLRKDDAALLATSREGFKRFPEEKRFYLTAGTAAGRQGQFDVAIDALEIAAKRWPEDAKVRSLLESALVGRGTRALDQGDNAKAANDLERAVGLTPSDAEAWMNLGRARQNLLRYADALEAFDHVPPATPLLRFHRGVALYSLGRFAEAIAELDDAHPPALMIRGLARLADGNAEAAVADLESAVAKMPDNAQAHEGLGRAYLRLNRLAEAETHLRRSVALDPASPAAANALVGVLMRTGKRDEARELARKAAALARERR